MLNAKSMKATIVLDPAEVLALVAPEGKQFKTTVKVEGKFVDVPLNGRGVRKAIALVKELGVENVSVIIQGKLRLGLQASWLDEAGILAQPRAKKPAPAEQVAA